MWRSGEVAEWRSGESIRKPLGQAATQRLQHSIQLVYQAMDFNRICGRTAPQSLAQDHLRFEFGQRTHGVRNELEKFPSTLSGLPLSDVGRHRNGGPPHLRHQPKPLVTRKLLRQTVHALGQIHSLLPNQQVLEMRGLSLLDRRLGRGRSATLPLGHFATSILYVWAYST